MVLDSALLHCLDDEAQRAYLDGVRPLLRPGGKLLVGCFSDANPEPWSRPGANPNPHPNPNPNPNPNPEPWSRPGEGLSI